MKDANSSEKETEVKFHISNPDYLIETLDLVDAILIQPRVMEINLRFDTPAMELSSQARVLRLRQDSEIHMTYKGAGHVEGEALARQEIEFTLSDFNAARHFLEALGYQVILTYEKYRQTYSLDNVLITIDEMPYGFFSEIEGPDGGKIKETAALLGLNWERRINTSYSDIFRLLKTKNNLSLKDLTFKNFKHLQINLEDINIHPADLEQ